jgi:hypothetical protein
VNRLLAIVFFGAAAIAVWWFLLRPKSAAGRASLITAERIGPTFVEDNQATQLLAYINTELASRDAASKLAEFELKAKAALVPGPTGTRYQDSPLLKLLTAYQTSGAHRFLSFDEFRNLAYK